MTRGRKRRFWADLRALCVLAFGFVALAAPSCKPADEDDDPSAGLVPEDLAVPAGEDEPPFDPNAVISSEALTDTFQIDEARLQQLFEQTPYRRPSFLETYRSNGARASTSIVAAGRRYGINPLVLVVHLQIARDLLAKRAYPLPSREVEFVFGCGCSSARVCDVAYAGLGRQTECLASFLRESLEAIAERGETANGWGPGRTSRTLDGVDVTPVNDATAALYAFLPRVQVNGRGNWLFERLFRRYAAEIGYFPVPP